MKKLNNSGELNVLAVPFVMLIVLFFAMTGFAVWAYMGRQDYKNNVDEKIAAASEVAKAQAESAKDKEFLEREKIPFDDYQGPASFGSVLIRYPKTWSAYVNEEGTGSTPIDAYFHPGYVPSDDVDPQYALRMQVENDRYADVLKDYDSRVEQGELEVKPFKADKVKQVTGVRMNGRLDSEKQGSLILLPMRDKTLKIWTEAGDKYLKDFNQNILPNFTFEP